jgi:hypothetical protein
MAQRLTVLVRPLVVAIIGLTFFASCSDTTIDPFENDGNYFTVFGFLDELESDHVLRVVPISRYAEKIEGVGDAQASIDAEVFTTDLNSGIRTRWTHHLEKLSDGTYGHIFRANFLVGARKRYRLEVIRSDGKMTTAETTVPYVSEADLFELGPEVISEDSSLVYRDIKIPKIPSPWEIQGVYLWGAGQELDQPINDRIFVQYGRSGSRTDDGGWQMRLNISDDQYYVRESYQWAVDTGRFSDTTPMGVSSAGVQVRILDSGWDPPGGVFDAKILSQPGRMSNVVNGYGYFGSVGLYVQEWNIEHLSVLLGYEY